MHISRRDLLVGIGAAPLLVTAGTAQGARPARPRLAAICTSYFKYSHSQHIVDRFLEGYGWNGTHHRPEMDLVAMYLDQADNNDISKTRLAEFPALKRYPTIAEALTLGGNTLAVDGVILIGEHGRYPRNDRGQTQYPRYEFFKQIVQVYKDSGRSVPLFNDDNPDSPLNGLIPPQTYGPGLTRRELAKQLEGVVISKGMLIGTYQSPAAKK